MTRLVSFVHQRRTYDEDADMMRTADLSSGGTYRYQLGRRWGTGSKVTFIMCNPSTADANIDDPTIRRCIGFARAWGHEAIEVLNLFAYRATKPTELLATEDPVGPFNERFLTEGMELRPLVVAAWGALDPRLARIAPPVDLIAARAGVALHRIGPPTKAGHPRHPLYLPKSATLELHD
jgi:hypothetical protein